MLGRAAFLASLALAPRIAAAQGQPLGPEFRVNTFTTGDQTAPSRASVAADGSGNFVVVWESDGQDASSNGLFAQRYDASGAPLGLEFRVNTFTTGDQSWGAVAADPSGNFIAVWQGNLQDGSGYGVFGQRYASTGIPLGAEFRVNTFTTGDQRHPFVNAAPSGDFLVVWHSNGQDGSLYGIFGQRYSSSGAPLGPEFRANTYTTQAQGFPTAASDSSGNFVVTWRSFNQPPDSFSYGVFGQRYDSSGAPLGGEFPINTHTTSGQGRPSVAADPSGNFIVVWSSYQQDGVPGSGVYGQRYAASGAPLGAEFRVNTYTTNLQYGASVAADAAGNFVVAWMSVQDGSAYGVYGQRYTASGAPTGPEFRVNTFTTGFQGYPSVASDPAGDFVVVWQGSLQDGSAYGMFGQRFGRIVPVELMRLRVE